MFLLSYLKRGRKKKWTQTQKKCIVTHKNSWTRLNKCLNEMARETQSLWFLGFFKQTIKQTHPSFFLSLKPQFFRKKPTWSSFLLRPHACRTVMFSWFSSSCQLEKCKCYSILTHRLLMDFSNLSMKKNFSTGTLRTLVSSILGIHHFWQSSHFQFDRSKLTTVLDHFGSFHHCYFCSLGWGSSHSSAAFCVIFEAIFLDELGPCNLQSS